MEITNNQGFPKALYDVLSRNYYTGKKDNKTFSVTEILNDPKYVLLTRRHKEAITVDASDLLWRTYGTMIHQWLASFDSEDALKEERLTAQFGDFKLTGSPDLYMKENGENIIYDLKFTTVWSWIYGDKYDDWKKQMNMYKYLLHEQGHETDRLKNILLFRDWQKSKFSRDGNYPQQVEIVNMEMMDLVDIRSFIQFRLEKIKQQIDKEDDAIPECSEEKRWQTKTTYAVKFKSNKKALRVLESQEDAQDYIDNYGSGKYDPKYMKVEERPGEAKRCKEYCDVCEFCHFYKESVA